MNIGIYLSTKGGSPLQVGLERGLNSIPDTHAEDFVAGNTYDYVLVFNQCSHTIHYSYENIDALNDYKIVFIDTAEYGWDKRRPENIPLYYSTFASGAMTHDTKNTNQQQKLFNFLNGRSFPYFLREYLKKFAYPEMYHPVDYPLYAYSSCDKVPNRDEYLARKLDLFMYWGASHPFRVQITEELRNCGTKHKIFVIGEKRGRKTTGRMDQGKYFSNMSAARATVSYDGYGSSSFREMEALCRTLLLKGETHIIQRDPLTPGVNCIEFKVVTSEDGRDFISTDVCEQLKSYLQTPEKCFEIYKNGYEHCMNYYTEQKVSEYVLRVIQQHDWNKSTPLLLN